MIKMLMMMIIIVERKVLTRLFSVSVSVSVLLCAVLIISAEAVSFIYCIMREVFWRRKSAKWMV